MVPPHVQTHGDKWTDKGLFIPFPVMALVIPALVLALALVDRVRAADLQQLRTERAVMRSELESRITQGEIASKQVNDKLDALQRDMRRLLKVHPEAME